MPEFLRRTLVIVQFILSERYKIWPEKGNMLRQRELKKCINCVQKAQFDKNLFVHMSLFKRGKHKQ